HVRSKNVPVFLRNPSGTERVAVGFGQVLPPLPFVSILLRQFQGISRTMTRSASSRSLFVAVSFALVVTAFSDSAWGQTKPAVGEGRYYGGDNGSTKYSPLDQIDKENVSQVKIAWTWDSPDLPLQKENRMLSSFAFENTPIMANGKLYTSTSLAQVAAINPKTG